MSEETETGTERVVEKFSLESAVLETRFYGAEYFFRLVDGRKYVVPRQRFLLFPRGVIGPKSKVLLSGRKVYGAREDSTGYVILDLTDDLPVEKRVGLENYYTESHVVYLMKKILMNYLSN